MERPARPCVAPCPPLLASRLAPSELVADGFARSLAAPLVASLWGRRGARERRADCLRRPGAVGEGSVCGVRGLRTRWSRRSCRRRCGDEEAQGVAGAQGEQRTSWSRPASRNGSPLANGLSLTGISLPHAARRSIASTPDGLGTEINLATTADSRLSTLKGRLESRSKLGSPTGTMSSTPGGRDRHWADWQPAEAEHPPRSGTPAHKTGLQAGSPLHAPDVHRSVVDSRAPVHLRHVKRGWGTPQGDGL